MTAAALIQCITADLHLGESLRPLGGINYRFRPDPDHDNAHVAIVSRPEHIERFLSITEGYRLVAMLGETAPPAPAGPIGIRTSAPQPEPAPAGNAATATPSQAPSGSEPVEEPDDAEPSHEGGESEAGQDGGGPAAPGLNIDALPAVIEEEWLNGLSDEDLERVFLARLGRKPNGRSRRDTIVAQITSTNPGA